MPGHIARLRGAGHEMGDARRLDAVPHRARGRYREQLGGDPGICRRSLEKAMGKGAVEKFEADCAARMQTFNDMAERLYMNWLGRSQPKRARFPPRGSMTGARSQDALS